MLLSTGVKARRRGAIMSSRRMVLRSPQAPLVEEYRD